MVYEFLMEALPWVIIGLCLAVLFACKNKRLGHKKDDKNEKDYSAEGMCIGMCLGVALDGIFGKNIGLGISLGMLIGLVIGSCIQKKKS